MTSHMIELIQAFAHYADLNGGPILEIGSYIEANQDHLNMRRAFAKGARYVGVDVLDGPGVDHKMDLLDPQQVSSVVEEVQPKTVLCLYVVEHVWDIVGAMKALGGIWKRFPDSWCFIATHQNQPFHGTDKYPDYWRVTGAGMKKICEESGFEDTRVFASPNCSNPEDVIAVQRPLSGPWPEEAIEQIFQVAGIHTSWERYC